MPERKGLVPKEMMDNEIRVQPAELALEAQILGRTLTPHQAEGLSRYLTLLCRWNARMNLVGPREWRDMLSRLVVDSWHLADYLETLPLPSEPLTLDLGAGAGIPGIPLRMFWKRGQYHMVESRQKRAVFIRQALVETGIDDTFVIGDRVERLPAQLRSADLVLSRAFMPWRDVLELAGTLLAPGGTVLVMALQERPERIPEGWQPGPAYAYDAAGESRYFWSFIPAMAPS
jgi:16S rRNA (guanine527-N7)-methyltransferase